MNEPFPTLSLKERDRRWERTRNLMRVKDVACLIVAGFRGREQMESYLCNDSAEGILIFPLHGEAVHLTSTGTRITRHLESHLRGEVPWVDDLRVGSNGPALVKVLTDKGLEKGRIGVVGLESGAPGEKDGIFPYRTWAHVLENLPGASFIELSGAFAEMMLVKSREELNLARFCAGIGEKACKKMLDLVRPGLNERELYAAIMEVIFTAGATAPPPHLILHSGKENLSWGPPTWTYQGGAARTLEEGDLVLAEIFPRYGGIETQQQMAVHIRPVNRTMGECARAARCAYEAGLSAIRPGITFQEVCDSMEKPVLDAGCWYLTPLMHSLSPMGWISKTGGVGIKPDSPMSWLTDKMRPRGMVGADLVLKTGMIFELEPNACIGRQRVNIGGTVIVTEHGAEELNKLSTEMHVIG
ncbi:MAG: M24 family metallopeptidase [Desulfobacterales bacterium]|nr:M24 family metallopeptidase [Desulfobacterales bacterium]